MKSTRRLSALSLGILAIITVWACFALPSQAAVAKKGRVMCPIITGNPDTLPFVGHAGWVDVYPSGNSTGQYARLNEDSSFDLGTVKGPVALIASFDHVDALPIIAPRWPSASGDTDVSLWGDFVCVPPGYRDRWDKEFATTAKSYYQTFIARSTHLYAITAFDGPKVVSWGNKVHGQFRQGGPYGPIIAHTHIDGAVTEFQTAHHTDHSVPFVGFRHGDIPVTPGRRYAAEIMGYHSHGGERFDMPSYVRPKNGSGYPMGRVFTSADSPLDGDLCLIVAGNSNGQIVENNIRSEEWDVRMPQRVPVRNWGQDFLSHGHSMAGLVFWASNGSHRRMSCKVRIREEGPSGKVIGSTKTAMSHECPTGPYIRYPDWPGPEKGYEEYYKLKGDPITGDDKTGYYEYAQIFQVAYVPDEVPLEPGKRYYVELTFSEPVLPIVDGDYYKDGFGYYDGEKIDEDKVFHSSRWTVAGQIVTYQNPGGIPNR